MRDMRDALGALGPVDGQNPELNNLTCSMTYVDEGDLVFLTSDGISDNFDPVVGKFVLPKKESKEDVQKAPESPNKPTPQLAKETVRQSTKQGHMIQKYQRMHQKKGSRNQQHSNVRRGFIQVFN